MNRIFLIIFLLVSNLVFSQSQILNGIDLNGPEGFVKVDDVNKIDNNDDLSNNSRKGILGEIIIKPEDW